MRVESTNPLKTRGICLDPQTRCSHWNSQLDIVAIKFKCCGEWYACYECHQALAGHEPVRWSATEFHEHAILCGACNSELTVDEYLALGSRCLACGAAFNPDCANHYDLYFET
jgi:uncharacterized CHY-type Zn-finger protein